MDTFLRRLSLPLLSMVCVCVAATAQAPEPELELRKLMPGDGEPGDLFACALDLDASGERLTAVVGSLLDDDRGADSGSIYVFERAGEAWVETAKLTAGAGAGAELGFSVAAAGGLIAAGAPKAGPAGRSSGSVSLFRRQGDGWTGQGSLVPAGLEPFDQLGHAVAVAAGVVAAGAPGDDDTGPAGGAVYVFDPDGVVKLVGDRAGAGLGYSLAMTRDLLVAGAPFDDDAGTEAGAAWVFERVPGGWRPVAKLTPEAPRPGSLFGHSVAVTGDRVAVGARLEDARGANSGAVYVFRRTETGFALEARLTPAAAGDEVGSAVELGDGVLFAGARFDDGAAADAGAVYRFTLGGGGWTLTDKLLVPGSGAGDELGFAVAAAGRAVLAGAYRADVQGADSGLGCVFETPTSTPKPRVSDLAIVKRLSALDDGVATFTVTVTQTGSATATGVVLFDPPADGLAFTGASGPCGGGFPCPLGTLDAGDTVAVRATYAVAPVPCDDPSRTTATNTASVASGVPDANPANDRGSATVVRPPASGCPAPSDLAVTKTLSAQDDGIATFDITVTQLGSGTATGVVLADPPAEGLTFASASGPCTGGFPCLLGTLAAGDTVAVQATYTVAPVPCDDPNVTTATNTAGATSDVPDADPVNDQASATVERPPATACVADLSVTKTLTSANPTPGSPLTFEMVVANLGPDPVTGAGVASHGLGDLLTPSWTCVPGSPGAACTPGPVAGDVADLADLPAGASVTYTLTGFVPPDVLGELHCAGEVAVPPGVEDPNPDNDLALVDVLVFPSAGLAGTKEGPVAATPGSQVVFEILLLYGGPGVLPDGPSDELLDLLPPELAPVSVVADQGTAVLIPGGMTWNGSLAPGETVALTFVTQLVGGALGDVVCNQGVLTDDQPPATLTDDPGPPGTQDPTCFVIAEGPPLIPVLDRVGLLLLALALGGLGVWLARRG